MYITHPQYNCPQCHLSNLAPVAYIRQTVRYILRLGGGERLYIFSSILNNWLVPREDHTKSHYQNNKMTECESASERERERERDREGQEGGTGGGGASE